MIRMIIVEMEETLVEVRASAARTIADQKEMRRHGMKLDRLQADWGDKAQLALSKDREDLARAALVEKRKASDMADQLNHEISVLDDSLRAYEADIEKLQTRLREARSRQTPSPPAWKAPRTASSCARCSPASASMRRWPVSTRWNAASITPKAAPMR
jgi:phage shock protein A